MIPARFKLGTLAALLLSTQAQAIGFGEIVLHSRIGEALRAEVPVLLAEGEKIASTACFSLPPLAGSDLPVVTSARTQLVRSGNKYLLQISGSRPLAEPIFVIGLRAACGFDLQRDYTLMPAEPLMKAEISPPPVAAAAPPLNTPRRPRNYAAWQAAEGDTLESIAESLTPDNMAQRQRALSALKRANPDLPPGQAMAGGQVFRMPNIRQPRPAEGEQTSRPRPPRANEQQRLAPPPAPSSAVSGGTGAGDRIVLGAPPEEPVATPNQPLPRGSMAEMEERMLRLETTLHQLNQEVDKLNKVLELTAETMAAQQKLQMAQALQSRPTAENGPAIRHNAPPAANAEQQNNWLELLFSALIGGGIAAGLAHLFSRRRNQATLEQLIPKTPASSVTPPGPVPVDQAPGSLQDSQAARESIPPNTAVDIPLDDISAISLAPEAVAVDFNETASALELAEIMLSYGRIKGAAETLARHVELNAPDNVQPWLMLLDLYRRADMRTEFDALSQRTREKFNMHIPDWDTSSVPASGLKALEDYAHITWRLVSQWGKQECMDYLYDLIHDNRAGQRFGFPLEIVEEIALLMRILEAGYDLKRPG